MRRDARASAKKRGGRWHETACLLLASAVVLTSVWLCYRAKAEAFGGQGAGEVLNLNAVNNHEELLPFLTVFEQGGDRQLAARAVYEFLRENAPVPNVGALMRVRLTEREIEGARGAAGLGQRLEAARQQPAPAPAGRTRWRRFADWLTSWSGGTQREPRELTLLTPAQLRQIKLRMVVRTPEEFRSQLRLYTLFLLAGFYAAHAVWVARGFRGDRLLLPALLLLAGVGFVMMLALRDPLRDTAIYQNFSLSVLGGCLLMLGLSLFDFARSPLRRISFLFLALAVLLSVALILFGSGPGASDATVNLWGGQPVEAIKLLVVLFLAGYFAERWEALRDLREKLGGQMPRALRWLYVPRLKDFLPVLVGMALVLALFFLQKDLGPAIVLAVLFLSLYGVARNRFLLVLAGLLLIASGFWVGYRFNLTRTAASRIRMWLAPWDNALPGGDQVAHSLWALATGGATGTGVGLGDPDLVPAAHTDLVLSVVGEEMGFAGILAVAALYLLLVHRGLRAARRASTDYTFFLALGLTLLVALPVLLIAGGILGVVPLSGVASPLLSYGGSSMLAAFAVFGVLAAVSAERPAVAAAAQAGSGAAGAAPAAPFSRPLRRLALVAGALALLLVGRAAQVQLRAAESTLLNPVLTELADGSLRYQYNPRLLNVARRIPRGAVYDRNGLPLATSDWGELERRRPDYERLGVSLEQAGSPSDARHYPFGALTFYLLGDQRTRFRWSASNTDFVERDEAVRLQGYDDRETVVEVPDRRTGRLVPVLRRDLGGLLPLLAHRYDPEHEEVRRILERERDVSTSIDVRLQQQVAAGLRRYARQAGSGHGAAVVLDADTGEVLARVSYPLPGEAEAQPEEQLFDRALFGTYPPGSIFKLVTAAAALRKGPALADRAYECVRLPGEARVGNRVSGYNRPVRDDVQDRSPHGRVSMERGVVISCNAYFAQLGTYDVEAQALLQTAEQVGIKVAEPNQPEQLRPFLPQASYGQGQVIASPLQMARVVAAIANGGRLPEATLAPGGGGQRDRPAFLSGPAAERLARYMRGVVTSGTGGRLRGVSPAVAGKTGTAEIEGAPSHSWFVGFAPYGPNVRRRIAFAVVIENGGYGGTLAAMASGEIVAAARELGIIR